MTAELQGVATRQTGPYIRFDPGLRSRPMARDYKVISADSHLDLNPEMWVHRVPTKWRERAPKRIVMPNGADAVQADNGRVNTIGITRNVGVPFDDLPRLVPKFSEPVGNGTPQFRL